jgi:hypothetical protein
VRRSFPCALPQAQPRELVVGRVDRLQGFTKAVGSLSLSGLARAILRFLRIAAQVIQVVAAERPERPVRQQVARDERLADDGDAGAWHAVQRRPLVRAWQPQRWA